MSRPLIISALVILIALLAVRPAAASHPQVSQIDQVVRIAHELEQATRHVYDSAVRQQHHGVFGIFTEGAGIAWLRKLSERARHFHREVESYRRDPAHTERDYRLLWSTFQSTRNALHRHMHPTSHVVRDFQRVEQLMYSLGAYYGGSAGSYYPGNTYPPYGPGDFTPYGPGGYPPNGDPDDHDDHDDHDDRNERH